MKNYLSHLETVGDQKLSFKRKVSYFDYNYLDQIKNVNKILEIGPGKGEFISYLNSKNIDNIDIIDNDLNVINFIQKNFSISKYYRTNDISKLKLKNSTYDLITMMQVFEHMPKSSYKRVMTTLIKSLKRGGKLIMMVPNGGNPLNMLERYHDLQHENAFTEDSLKELANYCDIDNVDILVSPYSIPPSNMINILRIFLQKILHLLILSMIIVNGGVYQKIMTPNISLIMTKK